MYKATGNNEVLPVKQAKYFTIDGVRYDLSADEYAEVLRNRGKKSRELINNLISDKMSVKLKNEETGTYRYLFYSDMSDSEKARAIARCYSEAGDYAQAKYMIPIYEKKIKSGDDSDKTQRKLDEFKDIVEEYETK